MFLDELIERYQLVLDTKKCTQIIKKKKIRMFSIKNYVMLITVLDKSLETITMPQTVYSKPYN